MPTPSAITGSVADLDADAQRHHERLAEDGGEGQGHHGHHHRAPAAERDEAKHDHGGVDVEKHAAARVLHHDVGGGLDAGVARGQQEMALGIVVRGGEGGRGAHHALERLGAVVGEIRDHRHHRAGRIEELRVVHRGLLRGVIEDVLVAAQREPLRVALEGAGSDLAHRVGQRARALHAFDLAQLPREAIRLHQRLVAKAAFRARLHDHRELVAGERVVLRHVGVVAVVARLGAKLRRAGVEIADLQPARADEAADREDPRDGDGAGGPGAGGEAVEEGPAARGRSGRRPGADVRQEHRQQQQVGEDEDRDTDARGEREVADHRDVDGHEHREADGVGKQRP
jgi:hypothetical protein